MDDVRTLWSAPTCRRFRPGDLSPGEGAFSARYPARRPHIVQFDGDKSPSKSGDESPHSRGHVGAGDYAAERSDDGALAYPFQREQQAKAVSRCACHRSPKSFTLIC